MKYQEAKRIVEAGICAKFDLLEFWEAKGFIDGFNYCLARDLKIVQRKKALWTRACASIESEMLKSPTLVRV